MAGPRWRSRIIRRFHAALGLSCPVCLLAIVVAMGLGGLAAGAIVLDRGRSLRQAELSAINLADFARQRSAGLLLRADATLRAAAIMLRDADPADAAQRARLNAALAQQLRAEPLLLGLYVVGDAGQMIATATAPAWQADGAVSACRHDPRLDPDQDAIRTVAAGLPALCISRGIAQPGFTGSVVAVLGAEVVTAQYVDLAIGRHGAIGLLDETGRPLARVAAAGTAILGNRDGGQSADGQIADWAALARGGAPASRNGVVQVRRIDRPAPGFVVVDLAERDVLAAWRARALLIGGSTVIVIAFVGLAMVAVRRCERREARRLERLAAMAAQPPDRDALLRRLAAGAQELVACESVPQQPDEGAPPDRDLVLSVRRPDLVWIGPLALRRRHGVAFTAGDVAFLRVLARIAEAELRQAEALGTAQNAAETGRRQAEGLRLAVDTIQTEMSDASLVLDQDWRIVGSNRNADVLFGEYPEDLRDRTIWELFPELAGSVFENECRRAVQEQHGVSFTLPWLRGDKWLTVRAFPRPPGLAVYLQDISRQVATDESLRQAAKMEAVGRLTGGIAHDFNNLLTVILGNTEIMELELPGHGELQEVHDQIKRAAQSAAELTRQLLAFGRRQPLSPADVDVGRLALGLDGLLRRTLGPAITVAISCPPGLWRARVDPTQLENAILNLAINARDAMPSGGRLGIEAANLTMRRPDADPLGEIRPGKYVVVSVSDTGIGIPADALGKVFEPFFSTKPPGRGTGLGLSMVYGFATQSGGHVRIASRPGHGTVVRLYLPSAGLPNAGLPNAGLPNAGLPNAGLPNAGLPSAGPESAPTAAPRPAETRPLPPAAAGVATPAATAANLGGGESILIVEDAEMVRDYAASVLTGLGYAVSTAGDGREALALLDRGLRPDLLLTDMLLPNGMDGLQVAEQVRQRSPDTRVLYMSGYIENIDAAARLDPHTNLLLKPFHRAGLAAMVRARLESPQA